ncbi:unnamed protein product [Sphagnum compactum]
MSKSASFFKEIMQVLPNTWVLKLRDMRRKSQKQQQPPAAEAIDQSPIRVFSSPVSWHGSTDNLHGVVEPRCKSPVNHKVFDIPYPNASPGKNLMRTPSPRRSTTASSMKTPTLLKAVSKRDQDPLAFGRREADPQAVESSLQSSAKPPLMIRSSAPSASNFSSSPAALSAADHEGTPVSSSAATARKHPARSRAKRLYEIDSQLETARRKKSASRRKSNKLCHRELTRSKSQSADHSYLKTASLAADPVQMKSEAMSKSETWAPHKQLETTAAAAAVKTTNPNSSNALPRLLQEQNDLDRKQQEQQMLVHNRRSSYLQSRCKGDEEEEEEEEEDLVTMPEELNGEKPEPVLNETPNGHCIHTLVIMPDLGRTCTQCGLVTERIEHMSFIYHAPRYLRNPSSKGRKARDPYCSIPDGEELQESLLTMSGLEVHPSLEDRMHPHQLEGFKFLSRNLVEEDGGGCMLAFAPGTGKSFLVISFIQSFLVQMPDAKPLIVAPKGMLLPWVREFKKWEVQEITTFNLYEAQSCVDSQLSMLQKWQQQERSVLLVGYSQFVNMTGEVGRLLTEGPGLLILDEGHLARTKDTKILKSLMQVRTKRRVLLSGTPFNNNFDEFYNTLELVRPGFMQRASALLSPVANALEPFWSETVAAGSIPSPTKKSGNAGRQAFKDVIVERIESGTPAGILTALKQLRILIAPFVAWHKGQILETLPGISDFTIMLHLTPAQKLSLALAEKHDMRDNLQKGPAAIYVHPILEQVGEKKRSQDDPRLQENVNVKDGAKLRWVTDLMGLCDAAGEKLLIFSEYLYSLALIENVIARRMGWGKGLQILRIDGKTQLLEREKIVKSFNEGQDARVLCASIKACGEGISLVGASRVVLLEVPWNPAVARQAISRAFRIGQKKKVVVYRLIAADTQEEKNMHESSTRKEWLSRLLFDQSIGNNHTSILWDVTGKCSDRFLDQGPLMEGVRNVLEREF